MGHPKHPPHGHGGRGRGRGGHSDRRHPQHHQPHVHAYYAPAPNAAMQFHAPPPPPPPSQPPMPAMPRPGGAQDVAAFVESLRRSRSSPNAPPNALTLNSTVQAICSHFQVMSVEELTGAPPTQIAAVRQIQAMNQRVWSFVTCFVQSRRINTLHECAHAFLHHEGIPDFAELGIGNSFVHAEAVQVLYGGPRALVTITTRDVLQHLRAFEKLAGQDAFRQHSSHIDRSEFMRFLAQQYQQPSAEAMGVFVDAQGFGVYVGMLRRIANQEMKEVKLVEQEFQKEIAQKVFELTKEKFSAENRQHALEDLVERRQQREQQQREGHNSGGQGGGKARPTNSKNANLSSLSLEILNRVTDIDVYLDNVLRWKANSQTQQPISSQQIAENDLKIRNQLTRFLLGSHKSKQHSRIKVVTWVLCSILAKINALLTQDDRVPDASETADRKKGGSEQHAKENESDGEECDCCCVGKDSCKCDCKCDCHQDSSDEEEAMDASEGDSVTAEPLDSGKSTSQGLAPSSASSDTKLCKDQETQRLLQLLDSNRPTAPFTAFKDVVVYFNTVQREFSTKQSKWTILELVEHALSGDALQDEHCAWLMQLSVTPRDRVAGCSSALLGEVAHFIRRLSDSSEVKSSGGSSVDRMKAMISSQFGWREAEELGDAFIAKTLQQQAKEPDTVYNSNSPVVMFSAPLQPDMESQVGDTSDCDDGMKRVKIEEAILKITTSPYLVSLEASLNWRQVYEPFCGPLRSFVLAHEMILHDRAPGLLLLCCCDGQVLRLRAESTPMDLERESNSATDVGVHLVSILAKYGNMASFPTQLVLLYLRSYVRATRVSIARLAIDVLVQVPLELAEFMLSVFKSLLSEASSSTLSELLWSSCASDAEKSWLRRLSGRLGVDVYPSGQDLSLSKEGVTTNRSSDEQMVVHPAIVKEEKRMVQMPKDPADIFSTPLTRSSEKDVQPGTVLGCQAFIEELRKKQFGVGLDIKDEATSSVLDAQQRRLERALKRLSDELYSENTHFVLELLQNADDNKYAEGIRPRGEITLTKDHSIVFHSNEQGFSEANIRAICDVGASTKASDNASTTSIGKKGIGFKSVFKVSDHPQVHSNGFHIKFNAQHDDDGGRGIGYILPHWIEDETLWKNEPGSTFVLPLTSASVARVDEIAQSMFSFEPSILLFLNRMRELYLRDEVHDQSLHFVKQVEDRGGVEVIQLHARCERQGSVSIYQQEWLVVRSGLDVPSALQSPKKTAEIAMALPLQPMKALEGSRPPLQDVFSFLPLRSYGFRFILQGDFELPSSREAIVNGSEWNQWLVAHFPALMEIALKQWRQLGVGIDVLFSVLPFENEIQAPFRIAALEMLRKVREFPCVPSEVGQFVRPLDVIDTSEWQVEYEDVLQGDALRRALEKRVLEASLSEQMSPMLMAYLRIERLRAADIIKLLDCGQDRSHDTLLRAFELLSKLWRRDLHSSLLLDGLAPAKCFPLHSSTGDVVWKSLTETKGAIFLPPDSDANVKTYSFMKDVYVLHTDFVQQMRAHFSALEAFLTQNLRIRRMDGHELLRHHVFPLSESLQSAADGSDSSGAEWTECVEFMAMHVHHCHDCPLRLEIKAHSGFRTVIAQAQHDTTIAVSKLPESTFAVFASTRAQLPTLVPWVAEQVRQQAGLNLIVLGRLEQPVGDNDVWKALVCDVCGIPALFDVTTKQSGSALSIVLGWIEREQSVERKRLLSAELAAWLDREWTRCTEDETKRSLVEVIQQAKWLESSHGLFEAPSSLWLRNDKTESLLRPLDVPFSTHDWTCEELKADIGLQSNPTPQLLLGALKDHATKMGNTNALVGVQDLIRIYKFLAEAARGDPDMADTIGSVFSDSRLIFTKGATASCADNPEARTWKLVKPSATVWSSKFENDALTPLKSIYPTSLQSFFVDVCRVPLEPSVTGICELLTSLEPVDTNVLKWWRKHMFPLLKQISKHAKKGESSDSIKLVRKKLKKVQWLPTIDGRLCSLREKPVVTLLDSELQFVNLLEQLPDELQHSLTSQIPICKHSEGIDKLANLFSTLKLPSLGDHVVEERAVWTDWLVTAAAQGRGDKKTTKKLKRVIKSIVRLWAGSYNNDKERWQESQTTVQVKAIWPIVGEYSYSPATNMFVNDQNLVTEAEITEWNRRASASDQLNVLTLFPWRYFSDVSEVEAQQLKQFLLDVCGMQSVAAHLTSEVVVVGSHHLEGMAELHTQVLRAFALAQRLLYHKHRAHYDHLDMGAMKHKVASLRCVSVEGDMQVIYRIGQKFSLRRSIASTSCYFDWDQATLYVLQVAGDVLFDILMEVSRKCFGEEIAAAVANVLYLAELQRTQRLASEEDVEQWIVETQQLPPLTDATPWIVIEGGSAKRKFRSSSSDQLEDGEVQEAGIEETSQNSTTKRTRYGEADNAATFGAQGPRDVFFARVPQAQAAATMSAYGPPCYPAQPMTQGNSAPPPLPSTMLPNSTLVTVGNTLSLEDRQAIGRWCEEFVYKQLTEQLERDGKHDVRVEWVNKEEESGNPYDLCIVNEANGNAVEYIEVKSTRTMEKGVFEITMNELDYAGVHGSAFSVYRVFNAGNASLCRVVKMRNPIALIRQKKIQLLLVMQ
ncbi:TPA: hypothetical protein N0F65_000464 [Lagenidium giganteum]|uniref:Protein NO VEIN C-terminal domain-containing protein n=1 Tax=Lagenidium giganteum TaxID=4803 RepID=A0AAV2Z147_9STRA|nr:TPA: hypothetical protein N0F65_000464 [Lagenidium giganteum]